MKTVAVLLAEGFEEVEAITPIDFLRRARIDVTILGVSGTKVVGARGITVLADKEISEAVSLYDGVVIPGGMPGSKNIADSYKAMELIKANMENNRLVAAICAAPGVVLGQAGLIGDRSFTCYPGYDSIFPGGNYIDQRVVIDGNLITSKGPGTAAEFSESLIEYLLDYNEKHKIHTATIQKD